MTATFAASRDDIVLDRVAHEVIRVRRFTVDAAMGREAAMRLDEFYRGEAGLALERVDVLREAFQEELFFVQQLDEGMGQGRAEFAGQQFLGEGEERAGVFAEVIDVEDGLWVREVEAREVCVETGVWGAEIWDACRRAEPCADLMFLSCINHQQCSVSPPPNRSHHPSPHILTITTIFRTFFCCM